MANFFYAIGVFFCVYFLVVCASTAEQHETVEKKRDGRLSDEEHYHKDGEHNQEYDHETFLGKEKKTYDQLTPDESKDRLGKIVDKIDKDHDGNITEEELAAWVRFTRKQSLYDLADKHWLDFKKRDETLMSRMTGSAKKKVDVNEPVEWENYKRFKYGVSPETSDAYKKEVQIDERRWKSADLDKDNKLSREEYAAKIQPWDFEHMRHVVAAETLEEMDKDHDGFLSLDEYLGETSRKGKKELTAEELKQEKHDAEFFARGRDKNKDGKLDQDEVKEWLFPPDYDFATADAKHLIFQADANKDKVLTKEEILEKYNVFVGSRATNYGEDLTRHDEF